MVFTSLIFLGFLAIVLCVYWALPGRRSQNVALLAASLFFYAWGEPRFVALILICAATSFGCGIAIERYRERAREILVLGSSVALGILFSFKYFDFFVSSAVGMAAAMELSLEPVTLQLLLPIGISFFTFQSVGYMVDVYRREIPAERDPIDFFLFVTFFPQLVAGPIERAGQLLAQIKQPRRARAEDFRWGTQTALQGIVKKVVVADNLAPIVNELLGQESISGPLVAVGCLAFAFQIYCDFSGYTDIARGVARCMGFRLSLNFRRPYLSQSPTEFWHRWHITLSTWFRDYVFIPLGGSRKGPKRVAANLFATFLLSGLWHGASLNFLLWGAFHGAALVVHKRWAGWESVEPLRNERIYPYLAWCANFAFVLYGWLLFRVSDTGTIWNHTVALFSNFEHVSLALLIATQILPYVGLTVLIDWMQSRLEHEPKFQFGRLAWLPQPATVALLLALTVLGADAGVGGEFIYFKF